MTDLQIDLLKVLKYIEDNSKERMFPYIRTISSFINCNPYSIFIDIIKKYTDICSKNYSLGQREIEEELTILCSLGFVEKKSVKGHKMKYSLTSQGLEEIQRILSSTNVDVFNKGMTSDTMRMLRNKFAYLNEIQNTLLLGHDFVPFKKNEDSDFENMMLEVFKETSIYSYASCVLNKFELEIFNYCFALNYNYKQIIDKFNFNFTEERYDIFVLKTFEKILNKMDSIMEGYDAYMINHLPFEEWKKLHEAVYSLNDDKCSELFEEIDKIDSDEIKRIDDAIIEMLLEIIHRFRIDRKTMIKLEDAALHYKDLSELERISDDIYNFKENPSDVIKLEKEKENFQQKIDYLEEENASLSIENYKLNKLLCTITSKYFDYLNKDNSYSAPIEEYDGLLSVLEGEYNPMYDYYFNTGQLKDYFRSNEEDLNIDDSELFKEIDE